MRNRPREEGQRWLRQAQEDLYWSRHLAEQGGYHLACFLSQQVAEKALKAFVYAQGQDIVIGHSVERLCVAAAAYEPEFQTRVRSWSILDGYYIPRGIPTACLMAYRQTCTRSRRRRALSNWLEKLWIWWQCYWPREGRTQDNQETGARVTGLSWGGCPPPASWRRLHRSSFGQAQCANTSQ